MNTLYLINGRKKESLLSMSIKKMKAMKIKDHQLLDNPIGNCYLCLKETGIRPKVLGKNRIRGLTEKEREAINMAVWTVKVEIEGIENTVRMCNTHLASFFPVCDACGYPEIYDGACGYCCGDPNCETCS